MLSEPPKQGPEGRLQLHASTIVFDGKAVAISGPAGCGKSAFAFALIAQGGCLLADDITWLESTPEALIASCPPALSGRIEARGVGILNADAAPLTPLHLVVDLGTPERDRIPKPRMVSLLGHDIKLFHTPEIRHFSHAIAHYMVHGLAD